MNDIEIFILLVLCFISSLTWLIISIDKDITKRLTYCFNSKQKHKWEKVNEFSIDTFLGGRYYYITYRCCKCYKELSISKDGNAEKIIQRY